MKEFIKKGEQAPDFDLVDQNGEHVKSEDLKGKKYFLSWHPLAFTPVCTDQMRALERNYETFEKNHILPFGVSVDPQPAKKAWAQALCLSNLRILSDFHPLGEMSKAFGIFKEDSGASGRGCVLIDENGKVLWSKEYEPSQLPDIHEILDVIKKS
ncbi:MAG: redoxin domain-containing protein [Tissierellia bacterium]|nr:redoxin domain-containing protein [Tissierellia bacterium]